MTAVRVSERPAVAWVVCFGASQPVAGGRVACPLETRPVPLVRCLDCHYLAAVADERRSDRDCQVRIPIG